MRSRHARMELCGPPEQDRRVLQASLDGDRPRQRQERRGGEHVLERGDRGVARARAASGDSGARGAPLRLDVRLVRLELGGALEARQRAVWCAAPEEDAAEVVQRRDEARVEGDRLEQRVDRSRDVSAPPVGLAEVGMTGGIARRERGRAGQHGDGVVKPAALESKDAELKGGVSMARVLREDLTIESLRLRQLADAVLQSGHLEEALGACVHGGSLPSCASGGRSRRAR